MTNAPTTNTFVCASCGYQLRGLPVEACCPECGSNRRTITTKGEHKALASAAIILAIAGAGIAIAPFILLTRPINDAIEFGAPMVGFAAEFLSIALAVVSWRYREGKMSPGRQLSTSALWISIPFAAVLGCCSGVLVLILKGVGRF